MIKHTGEGRHVRVVGGKIRKRGNSVVHRQHRRRQNKDRQPLMMVADTELVVPRHKRHYYLLGFVGALVVMFLPLLLPAANPGVLTSGVTRSGQTARPPAALNVQPKAEPATPVLVPDQLRAQKVVTKLPIPRAAATPATKHILRHRENRHHQKSVVTAAATSLPKRTDSPRAEGHKLTLEESFPDEEPQSPEAAPAGNAAVPAHADEMLARRQCQDAAKSFLSDLELDERSPINPHPVSFQEGSYRRHLYNQFARELVRCKYWGDEQLVTP